MKSGGNPPLIPQKVVELRIAGSAPSLLASVSVEATSIAMPVANDQGGVDQVVFRYSGIVELGIEIWIPVEGWTTNTDG
jgi:hypothetical protein